MWKHFGQTQSMFTNSDDMIALSLDYGQIQRGPLSHRTCVISCISLCSGGQKHSMNIALTSVLLVAQGQTCKLLHLHSFEGIACSGCLLRFEAKIPSLNVSLLISGHTHHSMLHIFAFTPCDPHRFQFA